MTHTPTSNVVVPVVGGQAAPAPEKLCQSWKIFNPASNRCVNRIGKVGLSLIDDGEERQALLQVAATRRHLGRRRHRYTSRGRRVKQVVPCSPEQIRNPASHRCVSKTGKIGKALMQAKVGGYNRTRKNRKN